MSGKHILKNKKIEGATVYDITPTILYYMGFPVGRDMDGRVLVDAIEDSYLENRPARFIDTYEKYKNQTTQKPIRSLFDEDKIKDKMRSLGYIN
jgi:hypothetical protein